MAHGGEGWGVGAGVGKAVPVSVTTLGISSSSSVAGGFSSHSLYLNTEVQLVLGPYGAVSSWGSAGDWIHDSLRHPNPLTFKTSYKVL